MLRGSLLQGLLIVLSIGLGSIPARADDWLPISAEELHMSSVPQAPAAPAIYLYRQVDRDDNGPDETVYERIKVLTNEGREFANIEIPYDKNGESIHAIRARTINPDGSIAVFDGTIFDKSIVFRAAVREADGKNLHTARHPGRAASSNITIPARPLALDMCSIRTGL